MDDTILEISNKLTYQCDIHWKEYQRKRNHSANDFIFLENVISEV